MRWLITIDAVTRIQIGADDSLLRTVSHKLNAASPQHGN